MPDYAETELIAHELNIALKDCLIVSLEQSDWQEKRSKEDISSLIHHKIVSVSRVGKALLFSLYGPRRNLYLASRLGMAGKWAIYSEDYDYKNLPGWALTVLVQHTQGKIVLVHTDPRRFGKIEIKRFAHELESLRVYGPDIRSSQFTREWMEFCCSRHKVAIFLLLQEQRYFAGSSSAVSAESLFKANIYPFTPSDKLSKDQIRRLFEALHITINGAISERFAVIYRDKDPRELNVYGRSGKVCRICNSKIEKGKVGKKSLFWCPKCQSVDWKRTPPVEKSFVDQIAQRLELT